MSRWLVSWGELAPCTSCSRGSVLLRGCSECYSRRSESWFPGKSHITTWSGKTGIRISAPQGSSNTSQEYIFLDIWAIFIGLWLFPWSAHLKGDGAEPRTLIKCYLIHSIEGLWLLDSREAIGSAEFFSLISSFVGRQFMAAVFSFNAFPNTCALLKN